MKMSDEQVQVAQPVTDKRWRVESSIWYGQAGHVPALIVRPYRPNAMDGKGCRYIDRL